jgi:hypothetical protein
MMISTVTGASIADDDALLFAQHIETHEGIRDGKIETRIVEIASLQVLLEIVAD